MQKNEAHTRILLLDLLTLLVAISHITTQRLLWLVGVDFLLSSFRVFLGFLFLSHYLDTYRFFILWGH